MPLRLLCIPSRRSPETGTRPRRIRVWYGGLVDGMRDASGQMYMRNRYYDPATGQFTQTDPIGLAGGLNAYGFAAGDPVSYSDPYGLCPESMRIANDACPGNLTTEQWDSAHQGAETLAPEEASAIFEKLSQGGISAAEIGVNELAHTIWTADGTSNYVLNTRPGVSFFELSATDRGYVLSHERGHELQNQGSEAERQVLWGLTRNQLIPGPKGALSRAFQRLLEYDATAHACSHSPSVLFCGP